ncbi:MAG TPA: glycosyltransferase [Patescibacteria group bacterium]
MNAEMKHWLEYRELHQMHPKTDSEAKVDYYQRNSEFLRAANREPEPEIAIVIPAHNEENWLPRTLSSINRVIQASRNVKTEVIIVNNRSTDDTAKIVEEFGAILVNESQKGVGRARQAGLEATHSSVKYVLTSDADTLIPEQWINRYRNGLAVDGVVFGYGNIKFFPDTDLKFQDQIALMGYNMIANTVHEIKNRKGIWVAGGANQGYSREAAMAIGGYQAHLQMGEDTDLMNRLAQSGGIIKIKNNEVITSSRRIVKKGILGHGVERLKNNIIQTITGHAIVSETYQDYRV